MSTNYIFPYGFEVDEEKTHGVIPYIPGQILYLWDSTTNAPKDIYITPDDKIFHLSRLDIYTDSVAGVRELDIYNSAGAIAYVIFANDTSGWVSGKMYQITYNIPFPMPAGYKLRLVSSGVGVKTIVSMFGYEVPFIQ